MIRPEDLPRFHAMARMVELDGVEAYFTLEQRFGRDVAGGLIVLFLRMKLGSDEMLAPWPPEMEGEIEKMLRDHGRLKD